MWSRKHRQSRTEGGRGIGARSLAPASGTACAAEARASRRRSQFPGAPADELDQMDTRRDGMDPVPADHADAVSGVRGVGHPAHGEPPHFYVG
nr:hypothetical protein GCM10020093_028630 [Planobispora longispora]